MRCIQAWRQSSLVQRSHTLSTVAVFAWLVDFDDIA